MLLPVSNQPVTICVKQIIEFLFYPIALQVMIKGKSMKCCVIIKTRAAK